MPASSIAVGGAPKRGGSGVAAWSAGPCRTPSGVASSAGVKNPAQPLRIVRIGRPSETATQSYSK